MSFTGRIRAAALAALATLSASAALAATDVEVVPPPGGIPAWTGATGFRACRLDEGAGDLGAAAFENAKDDIALRMGFGAGDDAFTVSARMLTENRAESLALLKLAMTRPRFDAEAMERVRRGILSSIRSRETDKGALASRAWRTHLFGDDPYARESTEEGVLALTAEDLDMAEASP